MASINAAPADARGHAKPQPPADRVLAGGPQLHRGFVDHPDAIAAADLRRIEHPPTAQGDAEHAQMIGAGQS